jgi:type IV pilus assembly protein PilW
MNRQSQAGETLVGLLVGLAVGALVLAGAASLMAQLYRAQNLSLQDSHAQQELQWALELVARELANAQYVADAWRSRSPTACQDPFCNDPEDLRVGKGRIDFSLDRNHDGTHDNDECTGLRLNAGALQVRTACSPEVWTPLTDTRVLRVTQLDVQLLCQQRAGWVQRSVQLQAQAQAQSLAPALTGRTLTLDRLVRLRNHLPAVAGLGACP